MFRRVLLAVSIAATFASALTACSSNDEEEAAWWEPLLAYVPAEQSRGSVDLINLRDAALRLHVDGPSGRTCMDILEESVEGTSNTTPEYDTFRALFDLGIGPSGVAGFPGETQGFIGFDSCQVELLAWAGDASDSVGVVVPAVDLDDVRDVLNERGYETSEHSGINYRTLGGDHEEIDPFTLGGQNRVLIDGKIIVLTPSHAVMHAAIDSSAEHGVARDDEAYAMANALGEFHAATFVSSDLVIRSFDEQVEMILGAVASGDPVEFERSKSQVIAKILEPYQDWGSLPPFKRVGFAYERTSDGEDLLKVVLPYAAKSDAEAAAAELARRLTSYEALVSGELLCSDVDVTVDIEVAISTVVATCGVERPGTWLQIIREDTLFLVEELPDP